VTNKQARQLTTLLRRDGVTLAAIAAELNTHGCFTQRGKQFDKKGVLRLLTPPKVFEPSMPSSDLTTTYLTLPI